MKGKSGNLTFGSTVPTSDVCCDIMFPLELLTGLLSSFVGFKLLDVSAVPILLLSG